MENKIDFDNETAVRINYERERFAAWIKDDRIPPIQRKHHWKTWLRAVGLNKVAGIPYKK